MATYNDVFEGFKALSPADRQRLLESARQFVKSQNRFNLRYGAKVQFKHSRTGVIISGTFIKMKTKYAEINSPLDQHGINVGRNIRWSVSPDLLIPLTPEQAKLAGV